MSDMIKPAEGVEGVLIRTIGGGYVFRVYPEDLPNDFIDYALEHSDIAMKIIDKDSAFYSGEHGLLSDRLDHTVATLGRAGFGKPDLLDEVRNV